jgi:hypothetical protein
VIRRNAIKRAARLYRGFREQRPNRVRAIRIKLPRAVMVVGYVEFIGYSTTHGRRAQTYRHDFAPGSRPMLCAGPKRGELYLIGGRYHFTERGIVDLDRFGEEIDD